MNPDIFDEYLDSTSDFLLIVDRDKKFVRSSRVLDELMDGNTAYLLNNSSDDDPANLISFGYLDELGLVLDDTTSSDKYVFYKFVKKRFSNIDWDDFLREQNTLHQVTLRLSKIEETDELFKQAIIEGQKSLGIDRLGILIYDKESEEMVGSWGIDESGNLGSEHGERSPVSNSHWVDKVLKSHDYVAVWNNVELKQWDNIVGVGWNAIAAMWDEDECYGWLACDNLLNLRPLEPWRRMIIGQYAKSIASFIVQIRHKKRLAEINENLEDLVEERNKELKHKISMLESAQHELIEAEKLASLGSLVAGVAHEVNTPVGVSVTAASHLNEVLVATQESYQNKTMKKSELENCLAQGIEGSKIILSNLIRAGELIGSFKKLAADQTADMNEEIKLQSLVDNIILSFYHEVKNRPIALVNSVPPDLVFKSHSGRIIQIISNLIKNSLVHAYKGEMGGIVEVAASLDGTYLCIDFFDDGEGVDEGQIKNIFDPFYTTMRGKGGTGLGLNVVHNIVSELGGKIFAENREEGGLMFRIKVVVDTNE